MKTTKTFSLIAITAFSILSSVQAYEYETCNGGVLGFYPKSQVFIAHNQYDSNFKNATSQAINNMFDLNASQAYAYYSTGLSGKLDNNKNEIWHTYSNSLFNYSIQEVVRQVSNCLINEADIVFNLASVGTTVGFTTSKYKNDFNEYQPEFGGDNEVYAPFQSYLVAGLSEAFGLNPVGNTYSLMNSNSNHFHTNGVYARAYLGEDTNKGLMNLYGKVNVGEDLAVSHWKDDPDSYTSGWHVRTRIYNAESYINSDGYEFNDYYDNRFDTRFVLKKNKPYNVEFTFENNGTNYVSGISVGYYISTNDTISTYDTLIKTRSINLNPDVVYTGTYSVTIPNNISPGDYYLGVIIDRNNYKSEKNENNNATYLPIRVL